MRSKTVVIHQPDFMPYLGFFHRFLRADLYVIFDNVQYLQNSKSWHNRDKIKTASGARWITVAARKAAREANINEIQLANDVNWMEDNLNLIKQNYIKAPFYDEIMPSIENLYAVQCDKLLDFNLESIRMLQELYDVKIDSIMASSLSPEGRSNELLVDILKRVGASHYLSGVGAKDYFDPAPFENNNIEVVWQDFEHPYYPQLHGEFVPYLSSVDMLFNCGVDESRKILRSI